MLEAEQYLIIMEAQHNRNVQKNNGLKMFIESENIGKIYDSHVGGEAEGKRSKFNPRCGLQSFRVELGT